MSSAQFAAVHRALFAVRHDEALQLDDRTVIARVLADNGVASDEVFARIDSGAALETLRAEHEQFAESHRSGAFRPSSPAPRQCSSG